MASAHRNHDIEHYRLDKDGENSAEISILIALCMFAFIMLAAFVATKNRALVTTELTSFFTELSSRRHQNFQLSDLPLGHSIEDHRARHPDAVVGVNAQGHVVLQFEESDAFYTVWYSGSEHQLAYRSRMDATRSAESSSEIINEIIRQYGAPSVSSCTNRITDGNTACDYSWWIASDIRVDIASRVPSDGGETLMTEVVTDTRLMGKTFRAERLISAADR